MSKFSFKILSNFLVLSILVLPGLLLFSSDTCAVTWVDENFESSPFTFSVGIDKSQYNPNEAMEITGTSEVWLCNNGAQEAIAQDYTGIGNTGGPFDYTNEVFDLVSCEGGEPQPHGSEWCEYPEWYGSTGDSAPSNPGSYAVGHQGETFWLDWNDYRCADGSVPVNPPNLFGCPASITYAESPFTVVAPTNQFDLTGDKSPAYAGSISFSTPPGSDCNSSCTQLVRTYDEGALINVSSNPVEGYVFSQWGGACSGSGSCSVNMDSDKTVLAIFEEEPAPLPELSLTSGIENPDGLRKIRVSHRASGGSWIYEPYCYDATCGPYTYPEGEIVRITRYLPSGQNFDQWINPGGVCDGSNSTYCDDSAGFSLTQDEVITARWLEPAPTEYSLTSGVNNPDGVRSVRVSHKVEGGSWIYENTCTLATCGPYTYPEGEIVRIWRSNLSGSETFSWSNNGGTGVCNNLSSQYCDDTSGFTLSNDETIIGNWELPNTEYSLNTTVSGPGSVSSNPGGIACPSDCDELYVEDSSVTLTASANEGENQFDGWGGDASSCGTNTSCVVVMSSEKNVTANFSSIPLSVSCTVSPARAFIGEDVTWTANASGGDGTYTYQWFGSGNLAGRTGQTEVVSYQSPGNKWGQVEVTSGDSEPVLSGPCTNSENGTGVDIQHKLTTSIYPKPGLSANGVSGNISDSQQGVDCSAIDPSNCISGHDDPSTLSLYFSPGQYTVFTQWVDESGSRADSICSNALSPTCNFTISEDTIVKAEARNTECWDGIDNDGDGETDWAGGPNGDPQCDNRDDDDEGGGDEPQAPQCSDGIDNDDPEDEPVSEGGDGSELADIADPGCHSDGNPDSDGDGQPDNFDGSYDPDDTDETDGPSFNCSDGVDNDEDGKCDYGGCNGLPPDPKCPTPWSDGEGDDGTTGEF